MQFSLFECEFHLTSLHFYNVLYTLRLSKTLTQQKIGNIEKPLTFLKPHARSHFVFAAEALKNEKVMFG